MDPVVVDDELVPVVFVVRLGSVECEAQWVPGVDLQVFYSFLSLENTAKEQYL